MAYMQSYLPQYRPPCDAQQHAKHAATSLSSHNDDVGLPQGYCTWRFVGMCMAWRYECRLTQMHIPMAKRALHLVKRSSSEATKTNNRRRLIKAALDLICQCNFRKHADTTITVQTDVLVLWTSCHSVCGKPVCLYHRRQSPGQHLSFIASSIEPA